MTAENIRNILSPLAHPLDGMYRQTVRARYTRVATRPDDVPYQELDKSMPVIYRQQLDQTGLRFVLIHKDLPWCHQDVALFALGDSEPHMLYDLNPEEQQCFFGITKRIVDVSLEQPDCKEAYIGVGFNPEDTAPGSHTISRLHANICLLDQEYLESRQPATKEDMRDWYYRMVFFEPFTSLYTDAIKNYIENIASDNIRDRLVSIETGKRHCISMRFPSELFGQPMMNHLITDLLKYLHMEYSQAESVFTDRSIDEQTQRFLPRDRVDINSALERYLEDKQFLSTNSKLLLGHLAKHIQPATLRASPRSIKSAGELWAAKGFSGAYIFRFSPNDTNFSLEFYPKVLSTQALTRGNGVNSGADTIKVTSDIEHDQHLQAKLERYERLVVDALRVHDSTSQIR